MKHLLLQTLLLWLQCTIGLSSQQLILPIAEPEPLVNVIGIVGETVQLPCNLSLNKMREIELILWYKGQAGKPIFTLDTKTTPLLKHLSSSSSTRRQDLYSNSKLSSTNLLNKLQQMPLISSGTKRAENRLVFNLTGDLAYLQIKQVSITDQSEYKCRVDYKQSRSDYHQVNLTIIVPPKSLKILNSKNSESLESLIGPYNEKDSLVLICQAKQAKPTPLLTWFRNGESLEPPLIVNSNQTLLDSSSPEQFIESSSLTHSSYASNLLASEENLINQQQQNLANIQIRQRQLNNGIVESEITILSLTRDFLLNRIECRSSLQINGQLIRKDYQIVSVTLDINLSPLIAKIRSKTTQTEFKANTLAEFSCEVIGSRPPPKIQWYLVTQSNQIIDLTTKKKHLSNSNSNQQSHLDDNLEEFSIYQHLSPSTSPNIQAQKFKSNQHSSSVNLINVNTPNDQLSATKLNTATTKQPFIFTIDYPLLSQDGNTSSSILKLRLSQRMHNNRLVCRATNFEVQRDSEIEDQQLLNILYAPLVRIELGSNIQENSIKEGNDVYFQCSINSNPYVNEIQWYFQGNLLTSNYNGILIANHSLVLQSVKRETKGYYSCAAINSQGKSHSQNFFLRILYAPVCRESQRTTYGLALGETAKILCEVDSDPMPNAFHWYFNNSNEKIPLRNFTVNQTSSILTYQPRSRYSYGILQCYGRNEIGSQIKSCNYQLVHASAPEVVKSCEILSASSKTAKNYLQQNTNFLKLITSTKNRNLIDDSNLINDLNSQSNKLITNYYTVEELKSTKSLLKTNSPLYDDQVTPSTNRLFNQTTNNLNNNQINNKFTNHSDNDLHPSQRLNFIEPTSPTQLQLNLDLLENAKLIKCQPGFNGGLKQIFFLEIYDLIEQRLYLNITSVENPVFLLTELKPNTKFNLNIYAANVKGRSSSVNLAFHTFTPQISNAKKQASEETIYGSFLSILVTIGTVSTLIFSLLMLFLRFKQPRNASIDRSSSSSTLPNNNQSQYKDAQLNPLKSSLSGRIYNDHQGNVAENYDYIKETFNNQNQHNLGLVQSEICFKQPEVTYAELSILSPNSNYSTNATLTNQTQNPADFVDLDFQLINHNHLAINANSGLPIGPIGMHTMTENDYSTYGQYNNILNSVNPLRIHYSTSLVDSPAMAMHSKLATLDTIRTLSSASTATVDTRQMIENTNCDLQQSQQYN